MAKETKTRYIEGIGRRKTSVARVRIAESVGKQLGFTVNGKPFEEYFPTPALQAAAREALEAAGMGGKVRATVSVRGGGISSQAGAVRHGTARALVKLNQELRRGLKTAGLLTRDPRMKERRKFGLKKARKASQWSKR